MNLSSRGLDFIVSFEGLLKKLPDGRYIAYRCPANVATIYAGCTEGVTDGMIVTEDEGKAMFRRELAKHEAAVRRLVKVDLTQNQFDALVSLSFNIGSGALGKSTLLKHLNKGDYARAASHFHDFKKAGGKVLKGLVRRRAAEAAMFVEDEERADMPQKIDKPDTKMKIGEVLAKVAVPAAAVSGGGAHVATQQSQPPPKPKLADRLEKGKEIKAQVEVARDLGTSAHGFAKWATGDGFYPLLMIAGAAAVLLIGPKLRERFS